jgi:uncharacterized membrane protein
VRYHTESEGFHRYHAGRPVIKTAFPSRPMPLLRHLISSRPRLSIALFLGIGTAYLLPFHLGSVARVLVGWNVVTWSYLLLVGWLMVHANHRQVRAIAVREDQTAFAVLAIMSTAAVCSIVAIVFELSTARQLPLSQRLLHYLLTASTVISSWCLVGTMFTFHYAVLFYTSASEARALAFPDREPEPDYWDFLYFSFTIAVAAQTSDVAVLSRPMRKAVLAQSVLSFFFNAAILGLSVNIAASAVGS